MIFNRADLSAASPRRVPVIGHGAGLLARRRSRLADKLFLHTPEDATADELLGGVYDFHEGKFDESTVSGQIEIKLTAKAMGGILGYFDSVIMDRHVFRYEAEVVTEGGIRIKTDEGRWGYQLYHKGAALKIKSFKKVNVESGDRRPGAGGESRSSRSRQVILNSTSVEWVEDSENTNTYPLVEGHAWEFIPFS